MNLSPWSVVRDGLELSGLLVFSSLVGAESVSATPATPEHLSAPAKPQSINDWLYRSRVREKEGVKRSMHGEKERQSHYYCLLIWVGRVAD